MRASHKEYISVRLPRQTERKWHHEQLMVHQHKACVVTVPDDDEEDTSEQTKSLRSPKRCLSACHGAGAGQERLMKITADMGRTRQRCESRNIGE